MGFTHPTFFPRHLLGVTAAIYGFTTREMRFTLPALDDRTPPSRQEQS